MTGCSSRSFWPDLYTCLESVINGNITSSLLCMINSVVLVMVNVSDGSAWFRIHDGNIWQAQGRCPLAIMIIMWRHTAGNPLRCPDNDVMPHSGWPWCWMALSLYTSCYTVGLYSIYISMLIKHFSLLIQCKMRNEHGNIQFQDHRARTPCSPDTWSWLCLPGLIDRLIDR